MIYFWMPILDHGVRTLACGQKCEANRIHFAVDFVTPHHLTSVTAWGGLQRVVLVWDFSHLIEIQSTQWLGSFSLLRGFPNNGRFVLTRHWI